MRPTAEKLALALGLGPHPEGGFYREVYRARTTVDTAVGPRAASTAIYYLLPAGSFSSFHRVRSDEIWHYYDGDPLELHTLDEHGEHACVHLGRRLDRGERPMHVVAAGVWQAAIPVGRKWSLCGCTVSPGFEFADFEIASRTRLINACPEHADLVTRFTRS